MPASRIVLSGMRPTGGLHLGHLRGVLHNWVRYQDEGWSCHYMVADWHALTTDYAERGRQMASATEEMVLCWLAAGIDPERSVLFVQSRVPEHAELHLILSMVCPLPWLERMPTFKDQQQQLKDRELNTYGFLGYPLLQSADILAYRAAAVPVGEDQVPHIEFAREIARRFNHLFGADPDADREVERALDALGEEAAGCLQALAKAYRQGGDAARLEEALALISGAGLSAASAAALESHLRGRNPRVLTEPESILAEESKVDGTDGRKMSKSYGNTIGLLEEPRSVEKKLLGMPTDPARVRRSDPGDPERCPVWSFHKAYSSEEQLAAVREGCTTAGIGCVDCKRLVLAGIEKELGPIRERAADARSRKGFVEEVLESGTAKARETAGRTLEDVRRAVGVSW